MNYTFNERMELLWDYAKGYARDLYLWRNLLSILAIVSIILPWAHLDGQQSSHSGTELIAHLFAGNERIQMLRHSPLGFLTLFFTPMIAAVMTLLVFWKVWNEREPLMNHLVLLVVPVPMLLFAGSLTSSQHHMFGSRMAPQEGVILLMATQLGMVALTLYADVNRGKRSMRGFRQEMATTATVTPAQAAPAERSEPERKPSEAGQAEALRAEAAPEEQGQPSLERSGPQQTGPHRVRHQREYPSEHRPAPAPAAPEQPSKAAGSKDATGRPPSRVPRIQRASKSRRRPGNRG